MGSIAFTSTSCLTLVPPCSPSLLGQRTTPKRPHRSLRILREFEPGVSQASAGRMFISGTMAEVCAELERLTQVQGTSH